MNVAVRYFSRGGNTKKVAEAIAEAVVCEALPIPAAVEGKVDVLFLGASVYWGGLSTEVKEYICALDKEHIGKVAVFSTSALAERAFPQIQKMLAEQGIPVEKSNFYCRGEFAMLHKGHPNEDDLSIAKKFAQKVVEK